jgi:phosphatidylethanolamine-binding protein (PEBP) family uncharacterized protein
LVKFRHWRLLDLREGRKTTQADVREKRSQLSTAELTSLIEGQASSGMNNYGGVGRRVL